MNFADRTQAGSWEVDQALGVIMVVCEVTDLDSKSRRSKRIIWRGISQNTTLASEIRKPTGHKKIGWHL